MPAKLAPVSLLCVTLVCAVPYLMADPLLAQCDGTGAASARLASYNFPSASVLASLRDKAETQPVYILRALCLEYGVAPEKSLELFASTSTDASGQSELFFPALEFDRHAPPSISSGRYHPLARRWIRAQDSPDYCGQGAACSSSIDYTPLGGPFLAGAGGWGGHGRHKGLYLFGVGDGAAHQIDPGAHSFVTMSPQKTGQVQAVPEPATFLLLSSGLAGVGLFTRKRKLFNKKLR
jgi:hypothetical protein